MDDTDSVSDHNSPGPSKRVKVRKAGATVYKTKFNHQWIKTFPFIREVKGDPYKFFCTVCGRQVACNHQGRRDVERHVSKALHQSNVKSLKTQSTLNFVQSQVLLQRRYALVGVLQYIIIVLLLLHNRSFVPKSR